MKNELKTGKLILGSFIFPINFNENPTLLIEEKINDDWTKQFTGKSKWNPFKFNIVGENKIDGKYELYDSAFIIQNNNSNMFKMLKCQINLGINEIIFDSCEYYD